MAQTSIHYTQALVTSYALKKGGLVLFLICKSFKSFIVMIVHQSKSVEQIRSYRCRVPRFVYQAPQYNCGKVHRLQTCGTVEGPDPVCAMFEVNLQRACC